MSNKTQQLKANLQQQTKRYLSHYAVFSTSCGNSRKTELILRKKSMSS